MSSTRATAVCAAVASAIVLTACSVPGEPAAATSTAAAAGDAPRASSSVESSTASPEGSGLSPPPVPGISWRGAGTLAHGHPVTYVASTDGGAVGLLWMDPTWLVFRLVPGYKVPEGGPSTSADNRPQTWVPRMVAAFNGGFLLGDHVGGYYYARRTVSRLVDGMGSLELSSDGRLQVGRWGRDLQLTATTVAVRQNLPLLVDQSRAMTSPSDKARTWGLANGGLWTANRSALGVRADGSLVYAYGHEVRPYAMAAALVAVGVERAMVLDMNKSWPGGFVYWHTRNGILGSRIQPQEYHSPGVYFRRYTKDFVAVLLR